MEKVREFLFQAFAVLLFLLALSLLLYQTDELTQLLEEVMLQLQFKIIFS